jgi:hypothetical protein
VVVSAADRPPGVVVFVVAETEAVVAVAETRVVSAAAERSPGVVVAVVETGVVAAAERSPEAVVAVVEAGVVFVAFVSVADVAEHQASADIGFAAVADVAEHRASVGIDLVYDVLVPVSVFAVEGDSSGRPRFSVFPNIDYYSSPSSVYEVAGEESVHSSIGVRTNYGFCSSFSNLDLHQNRNLGRCYNKPNPGHNNTNDTNVLPMDATTNHSRKKCLLLYQEQRTHSTYQAILPRLGGQRVRWVVAEEFQFQYLHLPLPSLERERQLPTPREVSPKVPFSFYCASYKDRYFIPQWHFLLSFRSNDLM